MFDFVFAGVISMFLWSGATSALESAKIRSRLTVGTSAYGLLSDGLPTLPAGAEPRGIPE